MDRMQSSKLKHGDSDDSDVYQEEQAHQDDEKANEKSKQDYIDTVRLVYITFKSMEAKELVQQLFIKDAKLVKEESNLYKLFSFLGTAK